MTTWAPWPDCAGGPTTLRPIWLDELTADPAVTDSFAEGARYLAGRVFLRAVDDEDVPVEVERRESSAAACDARRRASEAACWRGFGALSSSSMTGTGCPMARKGSKPQRPPECCTDRPHIDFSVRDGRSVRGVRPMAPPARCFAAFSPTRGGYGCPR